MVGLFSRLSGARGHRRAQSAIDVREASLPNADATGPAAPSTSNHGIEVLTQFKPVEHPTEPLDHDQPIKCPLPEPSILNDGRIWKKRMNANVRARTDLPVIEERSHIDSGSSATRPRSASSNHHILPSYSAPEHNIITLLEECNSAGI